MPAARPKILWLRLLACLLLAAAVWWAPLPGGLKPEAWHVFAVFVGVVAGFLLRPLDMAPTVLIGVAALILSGAIDLETAIASGFGDHVVWLVVLAFILADAVEATGLGRRIALYLLHLLGQSLTGLAYAVAATELVLAPFIPSNTARGGGVIAPIVVGIARTLGSTPAGESNETGPRRGGAYLVQVGAHSNLVTSAMLLTAMAGNVNLPIFARAELGVELTFWVWLKGSIVPGLAALSLVPLAVRFLEPPLAVDVGAARQGIRAAITELGPAKREEVLLAVLLAGLFVAWSTSLFGSATTVALLGVILLVLLGIRDGKEVTGCARAWDTLLWMGGFVALAKALSATGFTDWFAGGVQARLAGFDPVPATIVLALVYFASMYLFSQLTAHIMALAGVFYAAAAAAGAPPMLAAALIAYFSCLCGATTPWSSGPLIVYFGQGYVPIGRWMRNGLAMSCFQIALWLGVGLPWWRFLGWW
jgi:DASS family divalent anion:Na+ symporter